MLNNYNFFILFSLSFLAISVDKSSIRMKLKQCPNSPNCVSSQSSSATHKIAPISYKTSIGVARERIKKIILALPHTQLMQETDLFFHFEFKTSIFKFVDDVEIIFDDSKKLIHLRSASRVGHWDLGANRRRVEEIRKLF